jgi:hypothetical protein
MKVIFRPCPFLRPPDALLTLNGWDIPLVNHVKYLGVIFDKRITWGLAHKND